jgi:hypothetical protein
MCGLFRQQSRPSFTWQPQQPSGLQNYLFW